MSNLPSEKLTDEQWRVVDRTIVMAGLMLFEALLLKSGYSKDLQDTLMLRIQHLLQGMGVDYGTDETS